ncbi:MAG: hypothetical protein FRX48_06849 [Lasallia pustulata]|uniref:Uncharacterized protein n=1 Tax=Lasallia pustulata TaxID=136370 RepID=A0A5M8PKF5_9LECA|nr:MAG: hypothetical protein FRX48_06849 [Lasallia pustulata]
MRVLPDDAPLFGYVRQGDIPSVQSLFRQGLASPIDVAASDGRSVLHIAIYAGQPKTARFLIDQNADCEYEDKYFHSPVGACWEMTFQKVPTLPTCIVGESTEDIDFLDGREFTILHKIVLGIASIPLSEHLDFSNADINAKDAMGQTALHWASVRGDLEAIEILLASGADPNLLSDAHWSPPHHAAISAVPGTLEPLLRESAKVDELNNRGHTALSIAALVHDDPDFLNPLYRFGADVHSSNHSGQTSLHRTALRDNVSTARWLIDRGVDVNQPDKMGYTALHQCIRSGSHKTLALLLNAGCHTDMQASDARTILHDAAAHGDLKMLSILCEASLDSIDIEVKDSEGMRAEEIFEMLRHQHQEESDNERLESMRTFDSLLQKLKRYQQRPGNAAFDFATASPELALEVDEFLDAAERMESSQGTGSLETSIGSLILADNGLAEGASQLTLQVKSG